MPSNETDSQALRLGNRRPAQGSGMMTDDEIQSDVEAMIVDCVQFTDGELSPKRAEATRFYLGEKFGNEEEGRSQVVLTEVRDHVLGVLPQMLRVFFTGERVVEFTPRTEAGVPAAEQAIDYCNYVFDQDNAGRLKAHSVIKDGLVRKLGVIKWWWDDSSAKKTYIVRNLTQLQLELLGEDEEVEIKRVTEQPEGFVGMPPAPTKSPADPGADAPDEDTDAPPQPGQEGAKESLFTVELTQELADGRFRFDCLPPEEFVFSREARSIEDALCVCHRTNKHRGELIAMGYSEKDIGDAQAAEDVTLRQNLEEMARREVLSESEARDVQTGPENEEMLYCEAYVKIDVDGDGIAELRKVCTMGLGYHVVHNEPADERPFAIFTPDPEPHTIVGQSLADKLMDMQLIKSSIMRGMLDSLSLSIFPRVAHQVGQVNVADLLNTEIGAPVRTYGSPSQVLFPLTTPFTGKEAMPVLEMLDAIIERRTGQNNGSNALDMDALQSTEATAAQQAINASQLAVELLVWLFAEQVMKPLFRGMLRALCMHQPRTRVIRLRGKWVPIDPRAWDADMDVVVNVGLGTGLTEARIQTLMATHADQQATIQALGPMNPICSLAMLRNTKAKILELRGFKDATQFYKEVDPNWQPPPPPPPPPQPLTHDDKMAQASMANEQLRTQRELAIKEEELKLKQQQALSDRDLEIRKMAQDFSLRLLAINAQFKTDFTQQQLDAAASAEEAWLSRAKAGHAALLAANQQNHEQDVDAHNQALAAQSQGHDQQLAQDQQAHEQQMAEQAQATAAQQATQQPGGGTD